MSEPVLLEARQGSVLILTLNRPGRRNALNPELASRLRAALEEGDDDPEVRVVVITASGSAFCSGMDLKAFAEGERPEPPDAENIYSLAASKPLIAAVNGPAIAGGFELVLMCDIVVAARDAFFALPEVRRGLIAGGGGIFRLTRLAGPARAIEMLLTGSPLSAEEAMSAGLVRQVVEAREVLPTAIGIAERIVESAPLAVAETLAIAHQSHDLTEAELWRLSAAAWARVVEGAEAREGTAAFVERRPPSWPSLDPGKH